MAKEPKDENDSTGLRAFAKRIAQMKWWGEEPEAEQPGHTSERTSEQPQEQPQGKPAPDQQQEQQQDEARDNQPRREEPPTET
jgi:hypothetical protein